MPKKSRKFIDKNNSVTFHLVHRSQQDPLVADENAPQRVLVPVGSTQSAKINKKDSPEDNKRKEEQQKYGIFFDDDYNYLQHLKDVNKQVTVWEPVEQPNKDKEEIAKIKLPSSVFESHVEEKVGLLNKAAPVTGLQLDLDPDVIAALDDDFDFENPENELEDNFMELANADNGEDKEEDGSYEDHSEEECSENDEVGSLPSEFTFREEETKSRFTEYSMTSSVMRRNDQLSLLDNKFEKMYADYDENEIGALDCEEIEGHLESDSNVLLQFAEEFEKEKKQEQQNLAELMKTRMKIMQGSNSDSDEFDDDNVEKVVLAEKDMTDCESYLRSNTNIYNIPKLIKETRNLPKIKVNNKTGIPMNVLNGENKLTERNLAQFDNLRKSDYEPSIASKSVVSTLSIRPKNETPEQRKERKQAYKAYRRERRDERKINILAFKQEKKRQEKIMINEKNNIQGKRII